MPYIKTSDNININYQIAGSGEPLVLLHGLGSCVEDWSLQSAYFRANFKVIMIDLRGHGQSDKPRPHQKDYSVERMAKDVKEVLEHLQIDRAHFVGLSMGGCVAFQTALDFHNTVKTLAIVNAPVFAGGKKALFNLQLNLRLFIVRNLGVKTLAPMVAKRTFPHEHQSDLRKRALDRIGNNPRWAYYGSIWSIGKMRVANRLKELTVPTLVMIGMEDKTVDYNLKETLIKKLSNNPTVKKIKHGGHAVPLDSPEEFNTTINDWLMSY